MYDGKDETPTSYCNRPWAMWEMRSRRASMYLLLSEVSSMISANSKSPLHWNGCQGAGSRGGLDVLYIRNLSAVWKRVRCLLWGWYSVLKLEGFSLGAGRRWSPAEPAIDIAEPEWRDALGVYLVVRQCRSFKWYLPRLWGDSQDSLKTPIVSIQSVNVILWWEWAGSYLCCLREGRCCLTEPRHRWLTLLLAATLMSWPYLARNQFLRLDSDCIWAAVHLEV